MPGRGCHFLIPGGLAVIMRMNIHKPRCDNASGGINFFCATLCQITHRNDTVADNTDIHHLPRGARAIHH